MPQNIESLTTASLSMALDVASLRHQAIASNIANANTEGYIPQRVNFLSHMEMLQVGLQENKGLESGSGLSSFVELQPVLDKNGLPAKVQLDAEVAEMAHNAVHYQALIKGLSRHYSILASAVSDGKK